MEQITVLQIFFSDFYRRLAKLCNEEIWLSSVCIVRSCYAFHRTASKSHTKDHETNLSIPNIFKKGRSRLRVFLLMVMDY